MDAKRFDRWVRAYIAAWRTDDPRAIGALFSTRAVYVTGPFDRPWRGRAAIVARWIARGDSRIPWRFRHRVIASQGTVGLIEGRTTYLASGRRPRRVYGNLWLVRLNQRGQAEEFREWWMQEPA